MQRRAVDAASNKTYGDGLLRCETRNARNAGPLHNFVVKWRLRSRSKNRNLDRAHMIKIPCFTNYMTIIMIFIIRY
jgi:hypothetical protein